MIKDYLSRFGLLLQNTLDWADYTTVFISQSLKSQGLKAFALKYMVPGEILLFWFADGAFFIHLQMVKEISWFLSL